jgi:S1-C subfamily serine protease
MKTLKTIATLCALLFLTFSCSIIEKSQEKKRLNNLDEALAGTVTVAVKKNKDIGKVIMGFRGAVSMEAYEQSLKLSNALSSGSGFVVEKNGKKYIVTNAHVVENADDSKGSLYVYSFNRNKYEVKLIGGDSWFDIAVLEFVELPGEEFKAMKFAQKNPRIGEKVYAIGNPLGTKPNTVTYGVISALNRTTEGLTGKHGYLQSTATIIWGNSGGPLVNAKGEVVGVNTKIDFAQGADGNNYLQQQINYSLATEFADGIVDDIITHGKKQRAFMGMELSHSQELNIGWFSSSLGEIITVHPMLTYVFKGPNEKKLKPYLGQLLVSINGVGISDTEAALGQMERIKPGSSVQLVFRDEDDKEAEINIEAPKMKPEDNATIAHHVLEDLFSLKVDNKSPQLRVRSKYFDASAYVMAGGDYNETHPDLWRITTEEDLGGVLRIYGLAGYIDLVISDEPQNNDRMQFINEAFTNEYVEGDTFTTKLWY